MEYINLGLKPISELDARMLSPLKLAYLGDAVIDLYIRDYVIKHDFGTVHKLHKATTGIVNATAQASFAKSIESSLSENEVNIYKRGRNAKSGYQPKNANVVDYRIATGLEALFGYIYACGKFERLDELISLMFDMFFNSDQ
jgi:ribonuclease III family protein